VYRGQPQRQPQFRGILGFAPDLSPDGAEADLMEIAYAFISATVVLWVAVMAMKIALYRNDPLRYLALSRRRRRPMHTRVFRRARTSKVTTGAVALQFSDLPSRPINKHRILQAIKSDIEQVHAVRRLPRCSTRSAAP
jgi:hypothetical protein